MKIIELNNAGVSYRENIALNGVNLSIEEGAFVSIIGPNGAGKTTLLTVINALGKLRSGTVKVFGRDIKSADINAMRSEIGYIPQHLNIDPRLPVSVKEAVRIGRFGKRGLLRNLTKEDDLIVENAINDVGISHLSDKPLGHLSGGELQKVSIARALAQQPKIMLFDEPTSNLDPKSQKEVLGLIEKIYKTSQYTVLFVTHILSHIPDSCSFVVMMKHGIILFSGKPEDSFNEELLSRLYDCRIEINTANGRRHFHTGDYHP